MSGVPPHLKGWLIYHSETVAEETHMLGQEIDHLLRTTQERRRYRVDILDYHMLDSVELIEWSS